MHFSKLCACFYVFTLADSPCAALIVDWLHISHAFLLYSKGLKLTASENIVNLKHTHTKKWRSDKFSSVKHPSLPSSRLV